MGYNSREKKMQTIYGMIPMVIGFIIMVASGSLLNYDIGVILGGFVITLGGIFITSGK